MALAVAVTMFTTEERAYEKTVILLTDDKCDVCAGGFNSFVETLRGMESARSVRVLEFSPYTWGGKVVYKKLVENNVAVVPLVVFTKDLAGSPFFEELNEILADYGGVWANVVEVGDYYVLRPRWPVRRYVPGKEEQQVTLLADANIDVTPVKAIIYASADNVVIREGNAEGKYLLRVTGPPAVIEALAQQIPLSTYTSTSLEVPYVSVSVRAIPEVLDEVNTVLSRPNIVIRDLREDNGISAVAVITTDRPDIVAKLFPGAKVFRDGVMIDREARALLDVYLGGEDDGNILSELLDVASSMPERVLVRPHYIVLPTAGGFTSNAGPEGVERSVVEYCVFLNHGAGQWLSFVKNSREGCERIEECWEGIAGELGLDVERIKNCTGSKGEVLRFLATDTARAGVTRPLVLVNSWYVWVPNKGRLRRLVCSLLVFPPEEACRGVVKGGS